MNNALFSVKMLLQLVVVAFFITGKLQAMPMGFIKSADCYPSVLQVCCVIHTESISCNYRDLFDFDVCELLFTEISLKHTRWKSFS